MDSCEIVPSRYPTSWKKNAFHATKYLLIFVLLLATLAITFIIISAFFQPKIQWSDEENPSTDASELTTIQMALFQTRISLILVYLGFGFVAVFSGNLHFLLFFTFLSCIGILTTSLEINYSGDPVGLILTSLLLPLVSSMHTIFSYLFMLEQKKFYQGYLQA